VATKYDLLDASTQLEQTLTLDLVAALEGRGCKVIHNGTNSGGRHARGGKADIEIHDDANSRLLFVEVTRRRNSSADNEFLAVADHLQRAIEVGGYSDYGVLYVSPATSPRLSTAFRDLWNRGRERERKKGRVIAIDFATAELMLTKLAQAPSELYPAARFGDLFARWDEAIDDALTRLLVQQTLFPEDYGLRLELEQEADEFKAERELRLKKQLEGIEHDLRDRGVTGENANRVLVYLAFLRLYEERRQRLQGEPNRFTGPGFRKWCEGAQAATKRRYSGRMVEALLHEIAEDENLQGAGLLRDAKGKPHSLHDGVRDTFLTDKLLPVFDEYDFHAGRVDVLGAVFETLARRAEKDTRVGQFFTPQPVVDFCANVIPLRARDVVLDPAVGTARFLIRAMHTMTSRAEKSEVKAIRTQRLLGSDIDAWVATIAKMNMYIHGDGKTNIRDANGLALGDRATFAQFPKGLSGCVDVVLTNPPLGDTSHGVAVEHWQRSAGAGDEIAPAVLLDRLGVVPMRTVEEGQLEAAEQAIEKLGAEIAALEGELPEPSAQRRLRSKRAARDRQAQRVATLRAALAAGNVDRIPGNTSMKGGALFLGAIADYLKAVRDQDARLEWRGGWAGIVVDEAILNTPDYGPTRAFIRDRFYVKAVVSLSREAFQYLAHTTAKTSVLFLVRKPEPGKVQTEPVFYAHAERAGYSRNGEWIGDDLPEIKTLFDAVASAVDRQYQRAWLDPTAAQRAVEGLPGFGKDFYAMPIGTDATRLDFFNARYLQRCRELREKFGVLGVLGDYIEVAPVESPAPNRKSEYPFAQVSRVAAVVQPKGVEHTNYGPPDLWVVRDGHLVVSGIDAVNGSVAVAESDVDGMVMSLEMYAYRVRAGASASPVYLALLLRSEPARELLMGMVTGTSNRTRLESPEQLLQLPIPPLPDIDDQRRIAEQFARAINRRREAEVARRDAEAAAAVAWPPRQ
jgi:type I restriction-modification system DNA methylase subunit